MVLLASISTSAQFGVKVGFGQSSMRGDKEFERYFDEAIWVPTLGATYHWNPSILGLYPEILLSQKGAKGTADRGNGFGTAEFSISAWFLDVPLLLAFTPFANISFLAGPSASFFLSGAVHDDAFEMLLREDGVDFKEYTGGSSKEIDRKHMEVVSLGVVGGIQYMIPRFHTGIDARYERGFTSIDKEQWTHYDQHMKPDRFILSAVYLF